MSKSLLFGENRSFLPKSTILKRLGICGYGKWIFWKCYVFFNCAIFIKQVKIGVFKIHVFEKKRGLKKPPSRRSFKPPNSYFLPYFHKMSKIAIFDENRVNTHYAFLEEMVFLIHTLELEGFLVK